MKLEAAIFVPYGGQHRCGVYIDRGAVKVVQSHLAFDYKFSERVTHRGAPTHSELHDSPKMPTYFAALSKVVKEHITLVPMSDQRARAYTQLVDHPRLGKIEIAIEVSW